MGKCAQYWHSITTSVQASLLYDLIYNNSCIQWEKYYIEIININKPKKLTNLINYFFGEDQARYVIEIEPHNFTKVEKILKNNDIFFENIGYTQEEYFEIEGELKISTKDLFKINNQWYNNY